MHPWEQKQKVVKFVRTAVECSVYLAPTAPGLTREEIYEAGKRLGFQDGEIGDALTPNVVVLSRGSSKMLPAMLGLWSHFGGPGDNPDYRNPHAFDFVYAELQGATRSVGARNARLDRAVLVSRAIASGLPEVDVEAAITILVLDGHILEQNGAISFIHGRETYATPSQQLRNASALYRQPKDEERARIYEVVKDVLRRRSDGRRGEAEPFDAFTDELEQLGYKHFQAWWTQLVAELRRGDTNLSPVAVSVLSAALVEGALTFVVKHARSLGVAAMASKDFDRPPRTWKIDDLVKSAAMGQGDAILDDAARVRANELIRIRQRIHAGGLMSEMPLAIPDLRPEEAREARDTANLIVRRILDWLEKHPPSATPPKS